MSNIYELAEKAVGYYNEINKANFTDCMDVIVVRHKDGSLHSTPFYVRFGKLGVLKPKEKLVKIQVNNIFIDDVLMMLDECGEAFFIDDSNDQKSDLSKIALGLFSAANYLVESTSVPAFNNDTQQNDYLKAANTLEEFMRPRIEKTESTENEQNTPKFYINDSTSSLDSLKYNNPGSCYSIVTQGTDIDDSELEKLREKVVKIEKSKYLKKINLNSDRLKLLNLRPGLNEIKYFLINSKETTRANIFLWESTDKIVISDIDGTITKSDLRGHVMSMIGRDWYQDGVVNLFNSIENNGYKIVYLSARPICQCELTRGLIKNLTQNKLVMPLSAVLVNPVDFLVAFQSELIDKNPEDFKISCLNFLKSLFVEDSSVNGEPFFAGFGNKPSDELTYKAVGLDHNSVFIINPSGKIKNGQSSLKELSYTSINESVDYFFPRIK